MALEAVNQVAKSEKEIKGFKMRNVVFHTALRISSLTDATEVQFHLRPEGDTHIRSAGWFEFRAYFYDNEQWVETCQGAIQIEYVTSSNDFGDRESAAELEYHQRIHEDVSRSSTIALEPDDLYRRFKRGGNDYGPSFQRLENIFISDINEARAETRLYRWNTDDHHQIHIIHPTSLDGLSQLVLASLCKSDSEETPARVVTEIRKLWISSSGMSFPNTDSVHAVARSSIKSARLTESIISVFDTAGDKLRLHMEGLQLTTVADGEVTARRQTDSQQLCYHLEWKPDVELLEQRQAKDFFKGTQPKRSEPAAFYEDLTFLIYAFLSQTLQDLDRCMPNSLAPHLQKYIHWMRLQVHRCNVGSLPHSHRSWQNLLKDEDYLTQFCDRMERTNCQGKLYVSVGRNLRKIIYGELDPLDLFFKSNLLKDAYQEINRDIECFSMLSRFLSSLTHKNPGMRILEVGAGTGGATVPILESLQGAEFDSPAYSRYDFTDISRSFFEKAQEIFSDAKRMNFQVFDVEKDLAGQGFEPETYDMVIAANVCAQLKDHNLQINVLTILIGSACY